MATSGTVQKPSVTLQAIQAPAPWEAYLLSVSGFPVPEEELSSVRQFLQKLTKMAIDRWKLEAEFGIQLVQLHLGDGPARVAAHGREWIPQVGLGVWPDREPPKSWTQEDFTELGIGERPRELMYQVLRVSTTPQARENALNVMLGLGTALEILSSGSVGSFLERARAILLPPIKDPAYTCFPFYVPLAEAKSLRDAVPGQLDSWLCGCSVYIRESAEDTGVLIASRESLRPVLEGLGGRLKPGPEPMWIVPA